jgi:hypothetical protein
VQDGMIVTLRILLQKKRAGSLPHDFRNDETSELMIHKTPF